jgi:hypothetical protein
MISIIRLYALHIASTTPDPTWNNIGIANWSCIEVNTALICPSLTTLKPLISRVFPNHRPSANAQFDEFSTAVDVESNKSDGTFGVETIDGSWSRSRSSGQADLQSDTDMKYKENFRVQETEIVCPGLGGIEDRLHSIKIRDLPA